MFKKNHFKKCVTVYLFSILFFNEVSFAESCLNISGTYLLPWPEHSHCGATAVTSWVSYKQPDCTTISTSIIYKLSDGTFCEDKPFIHKVSERWLPETGYPLNYQYRTAPNYSLNRYQRQSDGVIISTTKSFIDVQGDLVSDFKGIDQAYRFVLIKKPVF